MAFDINRLGQTAWCDGQGWWQYKTGDKIAEVVRGGYFDPAHEVLQAGDPVWVIAADWAGWVPVETVTDDAVVVNTGAR